MKANTIGCLFAAAFSTLYCAGVFAADVQPEAKFVDRPPPAIYMGIELLKSVEQDLFAKLSSTQATALFRDLNEVNVGYCYTSSQGISVAFRGYATVYDTIELSRTPVGNGCKPVPITLDRCIGPLCLGASRDEVERLLGKQLEPADDGEMLVRYEYEMPMSAEQLKTFARFEMTSIPVTHVIWFRFDERGLDCIGVWRWEDLP
jgi:hypothetical protein